MKTIIKSLLTMSAGCLIVTAAQAVVVPPGQYYTDVIGGGLGSPPGAPTPYYRNDDGFFGPYNLGFNFTFFGTTYTQFYINNNGNVTFGSGAYSYSPVPLNQQAIAPMIAPFWVDVDTRAQGMVYVRTDVPNTIIVTWDQVGPFSYGTAKDSFQLVLHGDAFVTTAEEGRIGFFYKEMNWSYATGYYASVGFGDGQAAINPGEISNPASQTPDINTAVVNTNIWYDLGAGGVPAPLAPPLPASPPDYERVQTHADSVATVNARDGSSETTITGIFAPKLTDRGQPGSVFVIGYLPESVALAPNTTWYFDSAKNWHLFTDCRAVPAFYTGELDIIPQIPVVAVPTNLSGLQGAELYIGYGLGGYAQPSGQACNDMLARQNWKKVYTVEPVMME